MVRARVGLGALLIAIGIAIPARADDYPSRPIRMVVPNPPGGPVDIVARLIAPKLGERLGQTIVIDNRAGADGVIGSDVVAKAPRDGYTLLLPASAHAIHPAVYASMPFDTETAFAPIALLVRAPLIMVVHPSVPARTASEFIAHAKARPGRLDYGSAGNGGAVHLTTELFKVQAGVDIVHVPYKGGGPLVNDLAAGQIHLAIMPILGPLPLVRDGRLRALAVTGAHRVAIAPDIPILADSVPGFEAETWYGLLAPAGTPPAVIARLNAELQRVLPDPDVVQRVEAFGGETAGGTPEAFGALIRAEVARWRDVAKRANVRVD
jgi:tripartite-type tricarboxylate transporter receptor subunit TctC